MATTNNREHLSLGDRLGDTIGLIGPVIALGFFFLHQQRNTGFFTAEFGLVAQIALYGPIFLSIIPPVIRVLSGSRNWARPFDAVSNFSLGVGSYYLLRIFPFDYSHLADVLPGGFRFLLAWVTDPIARIGLTIMVVVGLVSAFAITIKFFAVLTRKLVEV